MNAWAPISVVLFIIGLGLAVVSGLDRGGITPADTKSETLEKFGQTNTACLQWSDDCSTCRRQGDGSFSCSMPGIACLPSSVTCRQMKQGARPAGARTQQTK